MTPPMRILHINAFDTRGGASRATYRLHQALRAAGADSTYYVQHRTEQDETVRAFTPDPSPEAIAHRAARKAGRDAAYEVYANTRSPYVECFSQGPADFGMDFFTQRPAADIINLNWVTDFVDYQQFFNRERTNVPVVWTLHDMNPFTGGCHYDNGCGKFKSHCGACPLLGSTEEKDLTWSVFEEKVKLFANWPADALHIVGPSRWTQKIANESALFGKFASSWIPPSIDLATFRPRDKAAARGALGLPQDAQIILFISHRTEWPRKGLRELVQALSMLPDTRNILLMVIGRTPRPQDIVAPFRVSFVNYIGDDKVISALYCAVDITAVPSKQDVGPLTMLESMACGTPVVGFDIGGVPDMVIEGETGFLAAPGSVPGLRAAFMNALSDPARLKAYGAKGRALVEREYSPKAQAGAYLSLYETLTETARR